jgi:hypothetical protein
MHDRLDRCWKFSIFKIVFSKSLPRELHAYQLKISVFRNITHCSLLKMNLLVGGKFRLHLKGRRINEESFIKEAASTALRHI